MCWLVLRHWNHGRRCLLLLFWCRRSHVTDHRDDSVGVRGGLLFSGFVGLVLSSAHAEQYGADGESVNMTQYTSTIATTRHVAVEMGDVSRARLVSYQLDDLAAIGGTKLWQNVLA